MEEYIRDWNALTPWQQEQAILNYCDICCNDGMPISEEQAREQAPHCCGWWVDTRFDFVTCHVPLPASG